MKKLAILISNAGTGTNLQAIIDAIASKKLYAEIVVVISSDDDAYGLIRARDKNIPTAICKRKEDLLEILNEFHPDFICLAGWRKIIDDSVIAEYENKILNLHPGLVPDEMNGVVNNPDGTIALWNRGKLTDIALEEFLTKKTSYAGSSIHFLTNEFDFGPVLGRSFEKIIPNDTIDTLYGRLKKQENKLYISVLEKLCNELTSN